MADLPTREALSQLSYPVAVQRLDLAGITVVSQQISRENRIGYDVTLTRRSDGKSATASARPEIQQALLAAYDLLVEADTPSPTPPETPETPETPPA